jgi:hypothetical protein
MREKVIIPIVLAMMMGGCKNGVVEDHSAVQGAGDLQLIEERTVEVTPAATTFTGDRQAAVREVSAWSVLQWQTPATELGARQQPMTVTYGDSPAVNITHDGVATSATEGSKVKSGGFKWTWVDSIMSGLWKIAVIAGIVLSIGAVISIIPGLGSVGSIFGNIIGVIGKGIAWSIPFVGGLLENIRAGFANKAFTQVVKGGQDFKALVDASMDFNAAQKVKIKELFRQSQQAAQDSKVQTAVRSAKGT